MESRFSRAESEPFFERDKFVTEECIKGTRNSRAALAAALLFSFHRFVRLAAALLQLLHCLLCAFHPQGM